MDLKLLKMLCKDSKQHHVMSHELYSVSSLLCIAQNVRFEIPYKVLYFERPFFHDIQILCLGFLWVSHPIQSGIQTTSLQGIQQISVSLLQNTSSSETDTDNIFLRDNRRASSSARYLD